MYASWGFKKLLPLPVSIKKCAFNSGRNITGRSHCVWLFKFIAKLGNLLKGLSENFQHFLDLQDIPDLQIRNRNFESPIIHFH